MKTLIELYDERPVENFLAAEVFRPEKTVFLCPPEVAQSAKIKKNFRAFLAHRGIPTEAVFIESSVYDTEKLKKQLVRVTEEYPECVLDVTGGTDSALFAGGLMCADSGIPAFTYSRKKNTFFDIMNASFADGLECTVKYGVNDFFMMAGGELRRGRVDNSILSSYSDKIDKLFNIFLKYKKNWTKTVDFIQRASQQAQYSHSLKVSSDYAVKGSRGKIECPDDVLYDLESEEFIKSLKIEKGVSVSFTFADTNIMTWLRDVGSVLELYTYKACVDCGVFNDVVMSAVVDWDRGLAYDKVTNEIDVMAMKGIFPLFISCKTCDVSTDALNELAILRDRFGGGNAKAAIVTTKQCRSITRHRARELDIAVIDAEDIRTSQVDDVIASLMNNIK